MNILKKLATPFVAIWRWIKETAWVQPLLIVGVIFAVIFSIPSITKAIQNATSESDDGLDYYDDINLSLDDAYNGKSEADQFFTSYAKAQGYKNGNTKYTVDDLNSFKTTYGEKFFLVFAQSNCEYCENISDALIQLRDNWDGTYKLGDTTEPYKAYSIICDQDMGDNADYYVNKKAFEYILDDHSTMFEDMIKFGTTNTYYNNLETSAKSTLKGYIENFLKSVDSVHVPCVVLFDLTDNPSSNGTNWNYIANTVFFEVPTTYDTNEVTRANFLAQAWYGINDFKIKK
ncbi:MAG: hypothetical protein WCS51_03070 [Bacilli bacterium]|jgi:hypothetical protein